MRPRKRMPIPHHRDSDTQRGFNELADAINELYDSVNRGSEEGIEKGKIGDIRLNKRSDIQDTSIDIKTDTGWYRTARDILIGADNSSGFLKKLRFDEEGYLGTNVLDSSWQTGTGWQLKNTGTIQDPIYTLYIDDLMLRGNLRANELILRQIRYSQGDLVLGAGGGKVKSITDATTGAETIVMEDPSGADANPFAQGDLILCQTFDIDSLTPIKRIVRFVSSVSGASVVLTTSGTGYGGADGTIEVGDEFAVIGNNGTTAGRDDTIWLSVSDSNSPFIRINEDITNWTDWSGTSNIIAQIGKVDGLTFAGSSISGAGAYFKNNVHIGDASAGTGIELTTAGNKSVTTGFAVWGLSNPKMFLGSPTSYMDYNNTVANGLFIGGYGAGTTGIELSTDGTKTITNGFAVWGKTDPKVLIGNEAGNYMQWNTTAGILDMKGKITITDGSGIANLTDAGALAIADDLDDVPDGTTYSRVLTTSISAGKILLSEVTGDLDDVADGGTYGKILLTDISSGHITLASAVGDLDDITDGTSYGKILKTSLSSGQILLSQGVGDLDDISDGTTYARVASTDITAGHITLVASTASININSTTFGNAGIQLQYNAGSPRAYIGNGTTKYFQWDGTNISWAGTNTSLTAAGAFTASNATITGTINANAGTFSGNITSTATINGGSFLGGSYRTGNTGVNVEINSGELNFFIGASTFYGKVAPDGGGNLEITSATGLVEFPSQNISSSTIGTTGDGDIGGDLDVGGYISGANYKVGVTEVIDASRNATFNSVVDVNEIIAGSASYTSADPVIVINRSATGTGNAHAFVDESTVNKSGTIGYNSFDADPTISGTNSYDHAVGFQARPYYNSTGTMDRLSGFTSLIDVNAGTVNTVAGYRYSDVDVTGGTVTDQYAFYVTENLTSATNNWAFYNAGTATSYTKGDFEIESADLIHRAASGSYGRVLSRGTGASSSQYRDYLIYGNNLKFYTATTNESTSSTLAMTIDTNRMVKIAEDLAIESPNIPASASATGTAGQIAWDSSYIYVCVATDTWKRVGISTW